MLLVELATQNVKGFSPTARAPLRPGYNVLVPPPGVAPGILGVLHALLYSDGTGADAALAAGPGARAGLTAQGTDGRIYRLVRGMGGGGALHRLEPNNQWAVVAQEATEIGRQLRAALGAPSREAFEALFSFSPLSLPSRHRGPKAAEPGKLGPGPAPKSTIRATSLVEQAMLATSAKSVGDRSGRAEALRHEVEQGKAIEEQQYKFEGLQQRLFQLDEQIQKVDVIIKKVDVLKQNLAKTRSLESLGLDESSLQLAAQYDAGVKKLREQLGKLAQEEAMADNGPVKSEPLWKDQAFLAGAGAGVVTMGLGLGLRSMGAGAVSLLSVPAFGYAGLCALRWIGKLQRIDSEQRRQSVYKDREQKLQSAFDADFLLIKGAMKVIEVDSGKEFLDYFAERAKVEKELAAAEHALAQAQGSTDFGASLDEHERLKGEVKALEAQIADAGAGMTRDWREAERELQEIEGGPGATPGGLVAVGGSFDAAPSGPSKDDPTPKLLTAAQELFAGASLGALGATLRERVSQYIAALTDRRYTGVEIDAQGGAQLVAPGRTVRAGQLEDLDLDLLYIALKLTVVERYAPLGKPVLVLEEPFLGLEDAKLALLSRMLKHIGGMTQVLHATALPAHQGIADNTVQG